jgi:UDP-N-acetylglucosamine 2-epimerase (non-hydrolysing)
MNITIVAGARPNFIKIAPIIRAIEARRQNLAQLQYRLVHTGQHYDKNLSETFFEELGIPSPHANLEVKSGSQAVQTAAIMVAFEKELEANPCDLVLVVGDVNSTMACAIVAKKMCIAVAHVEAGIRSGDWTMPEEINRIVTDSISDLFFTTSETATQALIAGGADPSSVHFVGNVMIDTLLANRPRFAKPGFWERLDLENGNYIVLTLHRPSNVDEETSLANLLSGIDRLCEGKTVIFPVHPRTRAILGDAVPELRNIVLTEPQGYLNFLYLIENAFAVITDSGGISEETTVLGVPCFTMRDSTERPETITVGTNVLVGTSLGELERSFGEFLKTGTKKGGVPALWDGKASERIVDILLQWNRS